MENKDTLLGNLRPGLNKLFDDMTENQACIQNAVHCHLICKQLIQYSIQTGGIYAEPSHLRLLEDCSEICETTANLILRESDLMKELCLVCMRACERCAARCRRFPDNQRMTACAEACEQTANSCSAVAAAAFN